jgi:hypothetical protein
VVHELVGKICSVLSLPTLLSHLLKCGKWEVAGCCFRLLVLVPHNCGSAV